jgi:serine/threonine protein kinase
MEKSFNYKKSPRSKYLEQQLLQPLQEQDIYKYINIRNFPDIIETPLRNGFKNMNKSYKMIRQLGKGSYGVVYLVLDLNKNKLNSIKFLPKKDAKREIKCLEAVKGACGKNILCYLGHFEYDEDMMAIVTDFDENYIGLKQYMKSKKITLDEKNEIINKFKNSINRLTAKGVSHGDLHIDNLLINISDGPEKNTIKIIDLGKCEFDKDIEKVKKENDYWLEKLNDSLNQYLDNISNLESLLLKPNTEKEDDEFWEDFYYGEYGYPEWENLDKREAFLNLPIDLWE